MSTPPTATKTFTLAQLDRTATNLETLADYIHQYVSQEQIDMEYYAAAVDDEGHQYLDPPEILEWYYQADKTPPCGATACALGHAVMCFAGYYDAQHGAKLPEEGPDYEEFGLDLFPAVTDNGTLSPDGSPTSRWDRVFGHKLSSKKTEVVQRLRDMAKEVRTLPAENIPDTRS